MGEFKEQALNATEKEDRIARKIAKIKRRQERKQHKEQTASNANGLGAILGALGQMNHPTESTPPQKAPEPPKITVGSYVRIKGQNTVGCVDGISGRQAKVLFGMMYTTLPLDRLETAAPPKEENLSKVSTFVSRETRDAMHEKKVAFPSRN